MADIDDTVTHCVIFELRAAESRLRGHSLSREDAKRIYEEMDRLLTTVDWCVWK